MWQKKRRNWMPCSAVEWLTVITLLFTISASLYGGIIKPYFLIRNMEVKVIGIEKDVKEMSENIDRLMDRIFYKKI